MVKWLIKGVIFILLWVVRKFMFSPEQGGPLTGMLYIGETIAGTRLSTDGASLIMVIFSFIITIIAYYLIAEIITMIIMLIFRRKD